MSSNIKEEGEILSLSQVIRVHKSFPSILCYLAINFMILCLHRCLSLCNAPYVPKKHDENCQTKDNREHVTHEETKSRYSMRPGDKGHPQCVEYAR